MKTFALPLMSAFLFIASVESYSDDRSRVERDRMREAWAIRQECSKRCEPMYRPDLPAVDRNPVAND